jgi:hypothetical protein
MISSSERGLTEIVGTLRVRIGASIPRDFQVRLVYQHFPDGSVDLSRPPDTYETGGRFPPGDADRHIEGDGGFCLWLPLTAPTDFDSAEGLALHLDRVRQFLRLQLVYEDRKARGLTPAWPGPEWKHGLDGYRQWAQEHAVGIDQAALRPLILRVWRIHDKHQSIHPASPCPCGSGRIWKSCHSAWARPLLRALKDPYGATVMQALLDLLEDKVDKNDHKSAATRPAAPECESHEPEAGSA